MVRRRDKDQFVSPSKKSVSKKSTSNKIKVKDLHKELDELKLDAVKLQRDIQESGFRTEKEKKILEGIEETRDKIIESGRKREKKLKSSRKGGKYSDPVLDAVDSVERSVGDVALQTVQGSRSSIPHDKLGIEETFSKVSQGYRDLSDKYMAKALQLAAEGKPAQGFGSYVLSVALRGAASTTEAATFPIRPDVWGRTLAGIGALATSSSARRSAWEYAVKDPFGFVVGDVAPGIVVGGAYGQLARPYLGPVRGGLETVGEKIVTSADDLINWARRDPGLITTSPQLLDLIDAGIIDIPATGSPVGKLNILRPEFRGVGGAEFVSIEDLVKRYGGSLDDYHGGLFDDLVQYGKISPEFMTVEPLEGAGLFDEFKQYLKLYPEYVSPDGDISSVGMFDAIRQYLKMYPDFRSFDSLDDVVKSGSMKGFDTADDVQSSSVYDQTGATYDLKRILDKGPPEPTFPVTSTVGQSNVLGFATKMRSDGTSYVYPIITPKETTKSRRSTGPPSLWTLYPGTGGTGPMDDELRRLREEWNRIWRSGPPPPDDEYDEIERKKEEIVNDEDVGYDTFENTDVEEDIWEDTGIDDFEDTGIEEDIWEDTGIDEIPDTRPIDIPIVGEPVVPVQSQPQAEAMDWRTRTRGTQEQIGKPFMIGGGRKYIPPPMQIQRIPAIGSFTVDPVAYKFTFEYENNIPDVITIFDINQESARMEADDECEAPDEPIRTHVEIIPLEAGVARHGHSRKDSIAIANIIRRCYSNNKSVERNAKSLLYNNYPDIYDKCGFDDIMDDEDVELF